MKKLTDEEGKNMILANQGCTTKISALTEELYVGEVLAFKRARETQISV